MLENFINNNFQKKGTEVSLTNVSKAYNNRKIVDGINLIINSGEFFCLLGPSGAGKSTLLNIIGGFIKPSFGSVKFNGNDVTRFPQTLYGDKTYKSPRSK